MLFGNLPTFDLFLFFGMPIIVFLIVLIRAIFKRKKYAVPLYFIGQGIQVLFSISLLVLFAENINDYLFNIIITIAGYLFWGFFFYRNRGFFTEEGF